MSAEEFSKDFVTEKTMLAYTALQPGNKEQLLEVLDSCAEEEADGNYDTETVHILVDAALLKFIGDPEITSAYEALHKWYA